MNSLAGVSGGGSRSTPVRRRVTHRQVFLAHAACCLVLALSAFAEEAPRVAVHLQIRDALTDSELDVSARRQVAVGTRAIDFMDEVVEMEYRRYAGAGVFVHSLCGIEAPKGTFWALSIDGKRAKKGISEISIEQPVRIRWDLVKVNSGERPVQE